MLARRIACCSLCAALLILSEAGGRSFVAGQEPPVPPAAVADAELVKFSLDEFPKGWKVFTAEENVAVSDIWKVVKSADDKDGFLQCQGKPFGYLRSETTYQDFEFGFEWRFPTDPNGNSGALIYTAKEDKLWPNAIQVQLHGQTTGSIFPVGDAMTANNLQLRDKAFAVNQWHTCVIRAVGGTISVTMDGVKQGEITGCTPKDGSLALQSEGSEVHFRKIWVRDLSPKTVENETGKEPIGQTQPEAGESGT